MRKILFLMLVVLFFSNCDSTTGSTEPEPRPDVEEVTIRDRLYHGTSYADVIYFEKVLTSLSIEDEMALFPVVAGSEDSYLISSYELILQELQCIGAGEDIVAVMKEKGFMYLATYYLHSGLIPTAVLYKKDGESFKYQIFFVKRNELNS